MTTDGAEDAFLDALVARAQRGDEQAFASLYARLSPRVLGFVIARTAADPEGIVNDVFLKVFRHLGDFRGSAPQLRAWIFTIARTTLIDAGRRQSRRRREVPTAPADLPDDAALATAGATTGLAGLAERLAPLPDLQREVVLLRIGAELSVAETAEALGLSESAVKSAQHRAVTRLRELFAKNSENSSDPARPPEATQRSSG